MIDRIYHTTNFVHFAGLRTFDWTCKGYCLFAWIILILYVYLGLILDFIGLGSCLWSLSYWCVSNNNTIWVFSCLFGWSWNWALALVFLRVWETTQMRGFGRSGCSIISECESLRTLNNILGICSWLHLFSERLINWHDQLTNSSIIWPCCLTSLLQWPHWNKCKESQTRKGIECVDVRLRLIIHRCKS